MRRDEGWLDFLHIAALVIDGNLRLAVRIVTLEAASPALGPERLRLRRNGTKGAATHRETDGNWLEVQGVPHGQPAHSSRPEEPPDMFERAKTTWFDAQRPRSVNPWTTWLVACMVLGFHNVAPAQAISREQMVFLTAEWKGERFPDGRPKVPDEILARMRKVSIEEAWGVLRSHGYHSQFEGDWKTIHRDVPVVGRALTAQYLPARPELAARILSRGHQEGRVGPMNSWPIDALKPGDVYVADGFGKIHEGTLIGDNLGNAIFAKSRNGVVFDGSVRDLAGL